MFKVGEELQKEFVPLFNIYGDRLDNLVYSLNKLVIIWPIKNTKNL